MAKYINMAMGHLGALFTTGCFVICCLPLFAIAQSLTDPTRPPAAIAVAESEASIQPSSVSPVLQSVLISALRKEAIISGRTVRVGDKVGEAWVIKITDNQVVLHGGKETQVLKLFPGIEKRIDSPRISASTDKRWQ